METVNKIVELITKSGITEKQFLNTIGLNVTALSDWKTGKNKSYKKHINRIAEYFNVSTDYLLGLDTQNSPVSDISKEERELLSLYNKLNTRGKLKAIEYMSDLSENERYSTEVRGEFRTRNA